MDKIWHWDRSDIRVALLDIIRVSFLFFSKISFLRQVVLEIS